ncbi:unnamed protein product [Lepidochelys kempii]
MAYSKCMEVESRLKLNKCIDAENQCIINVETLYWRNVLKRLISITLVLANNNLAFWGSSDKLFTERKGNFLSLAKLLGKYDNVMREHLHRVVRKEAMDHYCSKTIENKLIDRMARKVLDNILMRLSKAKYYVLIMECISDISHSEKLSFTVRCIDNKDGCFQLKERLICFWSVNSSTGKGRTELFMNILNENKIKLQDCRGQGYDSGADLKGRNSCVQARILALNPRAFFVPCSCHSLNLVVSDASSLDSVPLFGVLQRRYVLFSASTIRSKILTDNVTNLTVKLLSDTYWESRIYSVRPVRYQVTEVYNCPVELAQLSKAEDGI